jgi:hypothetical protein
MKPTQTTTQETSLFSTEIYSSGIGDIERSQYDPFWDEIILDSEITVIEPTGQTTLFYDSTIEPLLPEEFNSIEVCNAAHDSWCVNHPELVNHGLKKDSERVIGEDKGFKVGDKLFSNHAFGEMIVEVVEYPSVANDYINYDSVVTKMKNSAISAVMIQIYNQKNKINQNLKRVVFTVILVGKKPKLPNYLKLLVSAVFIWKVKLYKKKFHYLNYLH